MGPVPDRQFQPDIQYAVARQLGLQPIERYATALVSRLGWQLRNFANSSLKSGFYLDLRGGNWLDRSAVDLAESSKLKYADISLQVSRAGKHFLQGASSGLTPGKEKEEFLTTLHPSSTMSIKTTLRDTTDLLRISLTSQPHHEQRVRQGAVLGTEFAAEHKDSGWPHRNIRNNARRCRR